MANLKLSVKGQLSNLIPVSGNDYKFIVRYYNLSDILLVDSELIQNAETTVTLLGSNTFDLIFPIANGTYTKSDVKIKIYNNTTADECYDEFITNIVVDCDTGLCVPSVSISGTPTQDCTDDILTVDGTSLVSSGGTAPYEYAFIKNSEFTDVDSLVWDDMKIWVADSNTLYRIYTRGTESIDDASCYAYMPLTTIICGTAPEECTPIISVGGTVLQSCSTSSTVLVNGSSLVATGGNGSYLWSIIKLSDFTTEADLVWDTDKTWTVDHNDIYRIYVTDTSLVDDPTCYDYVTVNAQDCTEEGSGELEITFYYSE
jgi:hypothetical protein